MIPYDTKSVKKCKLTKKDVYVCEKCDYNTSYKHHFLKHLKTKKHNDTMMIPKSVKKCKNAAIPENETKYEMYSCICGKQYKYRQNLYRHHKKCHLMNVDNSEKEQKKETKKENKIHHDTEINNELKSLKMENKLLHEINKLKDEMIGLVKSQKINLTSINNSQINFNNKNEIKIFLNEQCANAMSIQDFVKQLTISIDDLINTKKNNISGITNIIKQNLKPLTTLTRPVHCVEKNEWFLKDKEEWREDNGDTFIDKACYKIQQTCLQCFHDENAINDKDKMELISLGTKELNYQEKDKIKLQITQNCGIK
jgi:hypothetical protein